MEQYFEFFKKYFQGSGTVGSQVITILVKIALHCTSHQCMPLF